MGNFEHPNHKTGLIGELLVKLLLNAYGVNTGSVDKDTGTDIIMFYAGKIRTAQVKAAINGWNTGKVRGVDIHFRVKLSAELNDQNDLSDSEIQWRYAETAEKFRDFSRKSLAELFVD